MLPINMDLQEKLKSKVVSVKKQKFLVFITTFLFMISMNTILIGLIGWMVLDVNVYSDQKLLERLVYPLFMSSLFLCLMFIFPLVSSRLRNKFKYNGEEKLIDVLYFIEKYKTKGEYTDEQIMFIVAEKYDLYKSDLKYRKNLSYVPTNNEEKIQKEKELNDIDESFKNYSYNVNVQELIVKHIF